MAVGVALAAVVAGVVVVVVLLGRDGDGEAAGEASAPTGSPTPSPSPTPTPSPSPSPTPSPPGAADDDVAADIEAADQAARTFAVTAFSYSPADLRRDGTLATAADVLALVVPDQRPVVEDGLELAQESAASGRSLSTEVEASGVGAVGDDAARVVLALSQTVSEQGRPGEAVASRQQVDLRRVDGRWLVGEVSPLLVDQEDRGGPPTTTLDGAELDAAAAAATAAARLLGYDHRTLGRDVEAATAAMTSDYARVYAETIDAIRAEVRRTQATTRIAPRAVGVVADTGPGTSSGTEAVQVVVLADQAATSVEGRRPTQGAVLVLSMVPVDGVWLVDGLTS